jgi:hypothetical protein
MTEAVRDGITVNLVYDGRAARVTLDQSKIQEIEDYYARCAEEGSNEHQIEESKKAVANMEVIIGDPDRLRAVAQDFVAHYESRVAEGATVAGKAMFVCANRYIAYDLYKFIIELRRRLIGYDLILFTEATVERDQGYADYADGCILSYDKISLSDIPSFDKGERAAYTSYSELYESSKTFMDISSFAITDSGYVDYSEAIALAARLGAPIECDDTSGICRYSYNDKRGEPHSVKFESLKNLKAKLSLLGELGFMGISIDIMRCPIQHLMMYNALFSGISYASVFANGGGDEAPTPAL